MRRDVCGRVGLVLLGCLVAAVGCARRPVSFGPPVRPRPLPEEPPLSQNVTELSPPARPDLPSGPLVRVALPDVEQPVPVPVLAEEVKDRASLESPTADVSTTLAQAAPVRPRT